MIHTGQSPKIDLLRLIALQRRRQVCQAQYFLIILSQMVALRQLWNKLRIDCVIIAEKRLCASARTTEKGYIEKGYRKRQRFFLKALALPWES